MTGLRKEYGDTVAVDRLDLIVPRGATCALLGPNGSGKTTTIRAILRITEPDAGEVRILGETPTPARLDRVGYLPEERGLYPRMKVLDVLAFLAEIKGIAPATSRPRIRQWLDRVDLADRAGDEVRSLSKGMQQKLQFVASIAHDPEIVILDEPFSGLDPINQEILREILAEMRTAGRTVLFSTHIIEHAERLCDHVCILARGRAVARGEIGEVRRRSGERFATVVLDPWSAGAVEAVRRVPGAERVTVDGSRLEVALADDADPQALLAGLVRDGVSISRFEIAEPSLRQVFLDRVGAVPDVTGELVPNAEAPE